METTTPSHTLLLFCKFLAHRVRTENLDLLYSIADDFLDEPPCFTRVDEMIYRVFPLVAVVPIEITDAATRAKADKVLRRMRERDVDVSFDSNELRDLAAALRDRIVLKNWDVLVQMFADFKVGRDHTLRGFVALQPEAIVMVPITPVNPLTQGSKASEQINSNCTSLGVEIKLDPGIVEYEERDATELKPSTRFSKDTPPAIFEIVRAIRTELDAIEATAPWERVFDVSKIVYPFDAMKHPTLAERFKRFWSRHARAVWQRHFWCRQPVDRRDGDYTVRQVEGKAAAKYYETSVIAPLFEAFGAAFFVSLDARPVRLHWWWYREPIMDLVHMASVEGLKYCKRYIRTQKLVPHPTPHPQFLWRSTHRPSTSASMWLVSKKTRHILDAIEDLKDRHTRGSRKAIRDRKRARTASRDSDEEDEGD